MDRGFCKGRCPGTVDCCVVLYLGTLILSCTIINIQAFASFAYNPLATVLHRFCISQLEISLLKLAAVSDRAAMALNPNYEAIGKAFVTQYYQVTCDIKEYWFKLVMEQGSSHDKDQYSLIFVKYSLKGANNKS